MLVQIAGVKTVEDAMMCAGHGCDFIGLLVGQSHTSDDFIDEYQAMIIINNLPADCKSVLITHLKDASDICRIIRIAGFEYVQLYSDIPETEVDKIKSKYPDIKLFRVIHINREGKVLTDINKIKNVDYYFTDSINEETNQVGGTGLIHDWNTDKELAQTLDKPLILAGGLTPGNVAEAIAFVQPYMVDVNTGVKSHTKLCDEDKVREFIKNAKS